MEFIYWLSVKLYGLSINLVSPFNKKAKDWITGRRFYFQSLQQRLKEGEKRIWFHCSSLGEFEQGKPVLEKLRDVYPDLKIVLTFFSPSGYNIKKNDAVADYVFYLPLDGPVKSKRFIEMVNPVFAVMVKYEFWHFYIKTLKEKNIPVFVISAIFRPSQIFFKPYGFFFKNVLQRLTHVFVQDQASLQLLNNIKITNATVSGDTRFDRVIQNQSNKIQIESVSNFKNGQQIFIAGSTWPDDEKIIVQLINSNQDNWKFIIAPHEISEHNIQKLRQQINVPSVLFSELKNNKADNPSGKQVLIIDNIGMLSSLYSYGDIAYIGGGFGAGIHNILEAAVFGLPVLFGPNYQKFNEAKELVALQTAFVADGFPALANAFHSLAKNNDTLKVISDKNQKFVEGKAGATDIIVNYLLQHYPVFK